MRLRIKTGVSLLRRGFRFRKLSFAESEYQQRRLDRFHRRYLSSIKSLAQIRKMGPAVQINIAEQQINQAR